MDASHSQLSSCFSPNYPPHDPTFFIPRLPDIASVHEPLPPKRPPPVGYDLKTLRKQIEYLHEELAERTKNHNALCVQNDELWKYIQELLEANKFNATQMRENVLKLNEELRVAQKERFILLEKLELARDSKKMLSDLERELQEAHVGVDEIQRRKQEAERELRKSRSEREDLEGVLREQLEKLHGCEDLLEQYRAKEREDEANDRADDFFFSSRVTLRAAYARFKQGVIRRKRNTCIHEALQRWYCNDLRRQAWRLWKGFFHRRSIMKRNAQRRAFECIALTFKRWKVYTALEKLFHQAERKKILTTCLSAWKEHARSEHFEDWAKRTTQAWKQFSAQRKVFRAWRSQVMFLDWCSPERQRREVEMARFFKHKLFLAWKKVTHREQTRDFGLAVVITHSFKRFRFQAWHALCRRNWSWRGRLLRRFFRNVQHAIQWRNYVNWQMKEAVALWVALRKRDFLRRWRLYLRRRRNRQALHPGHGVGGGIGRRLFTGSHGYPPPSPATASAASIASSASTWKASVGAARLSLSTAALPPHILHHYRRHLCRASLWTFCLRIAAQARQRLALQVARRYFARRRLHQLRAVAQQRAVQRCQLRRQQLFYALQRWQRWHRWRLQTLHWQQRLRLLRQRSETVRLHGALMAWAVAFRHHRRARGCGQRVQRMHTRTALARVFGFWRTQWMRSLTWKNKSLLLDLQRAHALQTLSRQTLVQQEEEQRQLQQGIQQLQETLANAQEMLADRADRLEQQREQIQLQAQAKEDLLEQVARLQNQLRQAEVEKERLHALEKVLEEEHVQQAQARAQRQQAVAARLEQMEQEAKRLQQEMQQQEELTYQALCAQQVEAEQSLESLHHEGDELDREISLVTHEIHDLEHEQESLSLEMTRVQGKLHQVVHDAQSLREDNERTARRRMGELKVAEADAGVAQARVRAWYEMIEEQRRDHGRMRLQEVTNTEARELIELAQHRREFEGRISDWRQHDHVGASPLLDTQPLWEALPREDLVNVSSPRTSNSEESLLISPVPVHAAQPPAATPASAFKRQRYSSPSRKGVTGPGEAEREPAALETQGQPAERLALDSMSTEVLPGRPEAIFPQLLLPTDEFSQPATSRMLREESVHSLEGRPYAAPPFLAADDAIGRVSSTAFHPTPPSSPPRSSTSSDNNSDEPSARSMHSAAPSASLASLSDRSSRDGVPEVARGDARDAIRALTDRLKSRLAEPI